ncbi:hypothetical protein GCM10010411_75000 [Actinomadura fulvescens]|uniref:Histidine kinase/HSP90-like ATPase domain-containing protein n=1 Tax=Actinomadura fulvescens TaxID=46160 RepID=A0ABN3QHW8_9ACTN
MTTLTHSTQARQYSLRRTYLALTSVARTARDTTRIHLASWDLHTDLVDNAVRVISEMVTNAIAATPRKKIMIDLFMADGRLHLEVWDCSPTPPSRRDTQAVVDARFDPNSPDPGGWGLEIIEALADTCGHRQGPDGGKTVFAQFSLQRTAN